MWVIIAVRCVWMIITMGLRFVRQRSIFLRAMIAVRLRSVRRWLMYNSWMIISMRSWLLVRSSWLVSRLVIIWIFTRRASDLLGVWIN